MDRIGEFIKQNESFLTAVLSLVLVLFLLLSKRKKASVALLIALSALAAIFVYCFPRNHPFGIPFTVLAASYRSCLCQPHNLCSIEFFLL